MLTLYTAMNSPGVLIEWALKELSVPHQVKFVDLRRGQNRSPEYLKAVPMGMVPALRDGDIRMVESGAILLYLQQKYGGKFTEADHALIMQWVLFGYSSLDPAVTSGNLDRVEALLMKLDKNLAGKRYLVDNRFTVADVAIGGDLLVISTCMPYIDFARFPHCNVYIKDLIERHPVPTSEASTYNSPPHTVNPLFA
eukprot:jgi/Botrbrau1/8349/Bobra.0046s0011.1